MPVNMDASGKACMQRKGGKHLELEPFFGTSMGRAAKAACPN
jgi:hypothetical protein